MVKNGGGVGYFLGVGSIEGVTFMEFYVNIPLSALSKHPFIRLD